MAEIEIGVVSRQCLKRRIPDRSFTKRQVAAWQTRRNAANAKVEWQFTTEETRIKLKSLPYNSNWMNHLGEPVCATGTAPEPQRQAQSGEAFH
ncbi:MAG: hypothetical protein OXI87_14365 [Albidovulum sp.]|nr:hypothetical protein [Albidovulum sp.]MDE0532592.1 hypothetical protein [Albidovulum sp.]